MQSVTLGGFRLRGPKTRLLSVFFAAMALVSVAMLFSGIAGDRRTLLFGLAHELALGGTGLFLFLAGFRTLGKKRLVDDTPTSPVRSVALGLAEVAGTAAAKEPLETPLTRTPCVFYRYRVEKEVRGSKGRRSWATVDEGCSTNYFYVCDRTGRLLVDPLEAETLLAEDYRHIEDGGLLAARVRHTEWYIRPGDYVYALGTVKRHADAAADRQVRLRGKLRALREDKARLMAFDTDGDGRICAEEWDRAVSRMEQELREEDLAAAGGDPDPVVMGKGEIETAFIIADRDEQAVARSLTGRCALLVCGGALLLLAMVCSATARAGFLPPWYAIPWESFYRR